MLESDQRSRWITVEFEKGHTGGAKPRAHPDAPVVLRCACCVRATDLVTLCVAALHRGESNK